MMLPFGVVCISPQRGFWSTASTHLCSSVVPCPSEIQNDEKLRWELKTCDATLKEELGVVAKDSAFTGTRWSSEAERQVSERCRFGRLWFIGTHYQADGKEVRLADLLGIPGDDEPDGGPPMAARYITKETHPHRLPSMEIQLDLIYKTEAFRAYLEGALAA